MYLTKSRFKIGMSCPTKLYYDSSDNYENNDDSNEFMKALAKGGIQVGEMAKLYYPGGIEIDTVGKENQLNQTNEALLQENVIIYEAAIRAGHKFIRVDVLEKIGNTIKIIEVKSASCSGSDESQFMGSTGALKKRKYLEDIAFQYLVCLDFFKEYKVLPYLMMADKTIESSVNDLYHKFVIKKVGDRDKCIVVDGTTSEDLGEQILTVIKVKETLEFLLNDDYYREHSDFEGRSFKGIIDWFEELLLGYEKNKSPHLSDPFKKCRDCEYKSDSIDNSGFHQCMIKKNNWSKSDFDRPKVWDVWNSPKLKDFLNEGRWFMDEIDSSDLNQDGERFERQSLQIENTNSKNSKPYVDVEGLKSEIEDFEWPLNLIDFETTAPAIPFFKGCRPYQGLPFQFSHHLLYKDGRVEHKSEFLGMGQGTNPSFKFIEKLYESLSENDGSVFMYSHHENTYLKYMIQLLRDESPFEKEYTETLVKFLQSLTSPGDMIPTWDEGRRKMKDMAVMVRAYYWHPDMKGSNSIKQVLPAIMNDSQFIKDKYSKAIYGKNNEVKSLNFDNHIWVELKEDGKVIDPYKSLKTLDELLPMGMQIMDRMFSNNMVGDGGAAMTSWAFMQFAEMKEEERNNIGEALKMYCELDTMAMVMIMEAWRDMIKE
jgi:hypothetical protein